MNQNNRISFFQKFYLFSRILTIETFPSKPLIGDKRSVELGLKYEAILEDWKTEYLDLILSIKIVDDLEEAITHIQK